MYREIRIRISAVLFILSVFMQVAVAPAAAQTRRGAKPAKTVPAAAKQSAPRCSGGWRGVVRLTKTLKDSHTSDEPGIRKAQDRIRHVTSRSYEYKARAAVDGSDPMNAKVNTEVNFTDIDKNWGEERVFDTCNSRESGHWFIIEGTDDRETTATASGSAKSFGLNVNEANGTYNFNLKFPDAEGKYRRVQDVKRSGHCQPKNNEPYYKVDDQVTRVDGESISVYGEKLDPDNPDVISGTKTWGDDGTGQVRTFVFTATWTFTRCPDNLLVTDLKFEEMRVPDWNAWQEVTEHESTIDGNLIRITAKVLNLSGEAKFAEVKLIETYKGDKWDGAKKDQQITGSSVKIEAGEEREVEWIWDSDGWSWYDDGRPRLQQRMRVEAWEDGKVKDSMTKFIRVAPKPIVFVAGLFSSPADFEIYQNLLTASHSYDWKSAIFTRSTPRPGGASVYDNSDDLAEFIKKTQKDHNAWHVDIVAHSTGGLVGRLYVHKQMEVLPDHRPVAKHLLMLGTPNRGVPCADSMKYNDAFEGYMKTAKEIMPEEIARFNQFVKETKGTAFYALVGESTEMLCASWEPSDGFVSVQSAHWGMSTKYNKDSHPDLVKPKNFTSFIKPQLVTGPLRTYPLFKLDRNVE